MGRSKSIQKYVEQIPPQTCIWRYLTPEKIVWLLRDSAIYFCQLKSFPDQAEGDISVLCEWFIPIGTTSYEDYQKTKDNPNEIRSYCGASCWSIGDEISFYRWQRYAGLTGAAIQTTVGKLQNCVGDETQCGFVEYGAIDYSELPEPLAGDPDGIWADASMFHKKPEYEWEKEFRAVLYAVSNHPDSLALINNHGLNIKVNLDELIEKLYLPEERPYLEKRLIDGLIESLGLTPKVEYVAV